MNLYWRPALRALWRACGLWGLMLALPAWAQSTGDNYGAPNDPVVTTPTSTTTTTTTTTLSTAQLPDYNSRTYVLTLPTVKVDGVLYSDVRVLLQTVALLGFEDLSGASGVTTTTVTGTTSTTVTVTTSTTTTATTTAAVQGWVPYYDSASYRLTLPLVWVDGVLFANVVVRLDVVQVLSAQLAVVPTTPATPTVNPNALIRACRLTLSPGGYADVAVYPARMDWTLVSNSVQIYFDPFYFRVAQGLDDSQLGYGVTQGHSFVWTGQGGFRAGPVPTGTRRSGTVTWVNGWFNPSAGFTVYNAFTGGVSPC